MQCRWIRNLTNGWNFDLVDFSPLNFLVFFLMWGLWMRNNSRWPKLFIVSAYVFHSQRRLLIIVLLVAILMNNLNKTDHSLTISRLYICPNVTCHCLCIWTPWKPHMFACVNSNRHEVPHAVHLIILTNSTYTLLFLLIAIAFQHSLSFQHLWFLKSVMSVSEV